MDPMLSDAAQPILAGDPNLSDDQRADLWDVFHASKSPEDLIRSLQPVPIPDDTKKRLVIAKKQSIPAAVEPLDKTKAVISQMASLDPQALDLAESHPNVLKALVTAAGADQKPEKPAAGDEQPQPLQQPPRADGLEHFKPIQPGLRRVMASDGGIHDIPEENLEQARAIDTSAASFESVRSIWRMTHKVRRKPQ